MTLAIVVPVIGGPPMVVEAVGRHCQVVARAKRGGGDNGNGVGYGQFLFSNGES